MFKITIPAIERYDEINNLFIVSNAQTLTLEHSLVSLSKWESRWCKPFLSKGEKTHEETIDYVKCMTTTQNVDQSVYENLTNENLEDIRRYIEADMTATTFSNDKSKTTNREVITAEIIYYWMIAMTIPFECQKWHLNRLLTLINVCNIKNAPPKKMNKRDLARKNSALNEQRKQMSTQK